MKDFATSDDPAVQAQLDRLARLSLPQGRFGLETIQALLGRLDDPHRLIPPAFHVAGTNGKGSTCAYLRSILEAQGLVVHTATKPHLVRYNERIRLAGTLISDALLAELLEEVLDASEDLSPSFFEVTTAATFLAFSRIPADACVIEVGLGGRFDATNVLEQPAACGIAALGIDHEAFLLREEMGVPSQPLARIAFEKASIAKPGCPLITQAYPPEATQQIVKIARKLKVPVAMRGLEWKARVDDGWLIYQDAAGEMRVPLPNIPGPHQADNAALAIAILRHQRAVAVRVDAMARGILTARWPARLQTLSEGPLTALTPDRVVWLDGGHNPDAGLAIARHFTSRPPLHLVIGMLSNKDPAAIVAPMAGNLLSVSVVPAPGHDAHKPEDFAPHTPLPVKSFPDVEQALLALPPGGDVLIAGSLYLAGEVLRLNHEIPD